jgi:disulfide bond formation protein DsbB
MTRPLPLILLVASLAVLAAALAFQYVGGLQPCELCLYERWPYMAAAAAAIVALAVGQRRVSRVVLILAGVVFLAGAGLAFYHVGVERHWFPGPSACTGPALKGNSEAALAAQLLATPIVRCDRIQSSAIGDLVLWNLAASLVLALLCGLGQGRLKERA